MNDSYSVDRSQPKTPTRNRNPPDDVTSCDYGVIELRIPDLAHLFNSMDASPFRERDLDPKADEFIVDWAKSFSKNAKLSMRLYVDKGMNLQDETVNSGDAIRTYFAHRAADSRRHLHQLLRRGRTSLCIGFAALVALFFASTFVGTILRGYSLGRLLQESLLIGGWVAMWRPMEIFLYDWWPILSEARLFDRLSAMPVEAVTPNDVNPRSGHV